MPTDNNRIPLDVAHEILAIFGITEPTPAYERVVPETIEFRASPNNGDNDGWVFAALHREEWAKLATLDAQFVEHYFQPVQQEPS